MIFPDTPVCSSWKKKSDALSVVPNFFKYVDTQFGTSIKCFRYDNATELSFTEFFQSKGVIHQYSWVEWPKQNSIVERKHQHLLNVAQALLFQSRVPITSWGECILTACHLINRTLSLVVSWQTPFFRLYKENIDYSRLRVFGSLCFVSTSASNRSKFHPRAIPSVFFGYPQGIKGYKLFDIEHKCLFVSIMLFFMRILFHFTVLQFEMMLLIYFQTLFYQSLITMMESHPLAPRLCLIVLQTTMLIVLHQTILLRILRQMLKPV